MTVQSSRSARPPRGNDRGPGFRKASVVVGLELCVRAARTRRRSPQKKFCTNQSEKVLIPGVGENNHLCACHRSIDWSRGVWNRHPTGGDWFPPLARMLRPDRYTVRLHGERAAARIVEQRRPPVPTHVLPATAKARVGADGLPKRSPRSSHGDPPSERTGHTQMMSRGLSAGEGLLDLACGVSRFCGVVT